ncbi:MAG: two-component sensor histidine kinase [endosymbiont of Galathealinum brachiosum]|uniref:histidine kinase n=1 Tax=endosymbiont of Galathealinum brachiosum TaxID=2200906 RepID=A0A370DNZ5_9GAMM|nr:MAG: two-component sensor histidine kinase [endosymbiont of Galathealinum brachiosum]
MLPKTLFARTLAMIATVAVAYLLFAFSIIGYFMLVPVGKQSANDLAALMVFSANRWSEISMEERIEFEHHLFEKYKLNIAGSQQLRSVNFKPLPYYYFLESSLESLTGQEVHLKISKDDNDIDWYWANFRVNKQDIRIGFSSSHINAQPPLVLILLLSVGGLAILVTAAVIVRHLTTPLECLSQNALRIGSGEQPELVPETGAEEMATLAKSFNKMAVQVKELLSNRTTLLAGISHDLRTPLARIQLALEMLPANADPVLVDGIRGDVEQMNCLIGQFLELSKTLEKGEQQNIDIVETLDDLVNCARRGGAEIQWKIAEPCTLINNPMAIRRIIVNLLENAVRYGEEHPVNINYSLKDNFAIIKIKDRGPGIPADEIEAVFRPFYRLEQSRNLETGGTGLGLSIALQLAEINNIKIKLYGRKNGGTVAEIAIPLKRLI